MKTLKSISEITKVFNTGENPVLVLCEDLDVYCCKHNNGISCASLIKEYLAFSFLKIWEIKIPEFAFVRISEKHYRNCIDFNLQPRYFFNTCFATKYIENAIDIDNFSNLLLQKKKLKISKYDFLKIALFDIWIANEDRNANNANLLLNSYSGTYYFYPIDHSAIFNNQCIACDKKMEQITEEDTILAHNITKVLFPKITFKNKIKKEEFRNYISNLYVDFGKYINICSESIKLILDEVPDDWGVNKTDAEQYLNNNLFCKDWINSSKNNFKYFLIRHLKG